MTEPLNAEEIEALRGALDRGGAPGGWDAHKWFRRLLATLDRDRAEAAASVRAALERAKTRIGMLHTMERPAAKGGASWTWVSRHAVQSIIASELAILDSATPNVSTEPSSEPGLREAARRYQSSEWALRFEQDRGEPMATPEHNARVEEWRTADRELRAALRGVPSPRDPAPDVPPVPGPDRPTS